MNRRDLALYFNSPVYLAVHDRGGVFVHRGTLRAIRTTSDGDTAEVVTSIGLVVIGPTDNCSPAASDAGRAVASMLYAQEREAELASPLAEAVAPPAAGPIAETF